ncbi:MAG TPA: hypothetical protein VK606_06055, partial [Verrucomicrobiae bacterium]|nr:hypothetical protein [Verrucomicrobiae bacterium]
HATSEGSVPVVLFANSVVHSGGKLVALAFLVAVVGLALQFSPIPHQRLSEALAAACWVVAVAIAAGLFLPLTTFLAVVGVAVGLWIAYIVRLVQSPPKAATKSISPVPDPCGDPRVRLKKLKSSAKHLGHELEHFDNRWPAVKNKDFDGKLPDRRHETHAEAMQALQWAFAFYFSASRTYEYQCSSHHGRRQERLLKQLEKVYNALGLYPGDDTDFPLKSGWLHTIGERSTKRWGEPEADPISEADFGAELTNNPSLAESLEPVRTLLFRAAPGTDARARLKKAERAVKRVKRKLTYCYRP